MLKQKLQPRVSVEIKILHSHNQYYIYSLFKANEISEAIKAVDDALVALK
jgi:hypothetical protein